MVWKQVKRDLLHNRDPDYDSDEEEPWAYNTLRESSACFTRFGGASFTRVFRLIPLASFLLLSFFADATTFPSRPAVRRATLTMVNPATGIRGPAKGMAEFEEWQRRRANGFDSDAAGAELDDGRGDGGGEGASEMGDDE